MLLFYAKHPCIPKVCVFMMALWLMQHYIGTNPGLRPRPFSLPADLNWGHVRHVSASLLYFKTLALLFFPHAFDRLLMCRTCRGAARGFHTIGWVGLDFFFSSTWHSGTSSCTSILSWALGLVSMTIAALPLELFFLTPKKALFLFQSIIHNCFFNWMVWHIIDPLWAFTSFRPAAGGAESSAG